MKKVLGISLILLLRIGSLQGEEISFDKRVQKSWKWDNTKRASHFSDVTLWTSAAYPYLYALEHEKDLSILQEKITIMGLTHGLAITINGLVKIRVGRTRPNGKDNLSFYSGHTSASFTSAGMVCWQTSNKNCHIALALAAATGYFRIAGNWHWFSDVFVGAMVGSMNGMVIPTITFRY